MRRADKNVIDLEKNKVMIFSIETFQNEIVSGNCCFICGSRREAKKFNDEHVFPDWLLRELDLYDRKIALPNRRSVIYSQYKVPCCSDCNSFLGAEIETPISTAFKGGYDGIINYMQDKPDKFFTWLSLVFFKVYLNDTRFRWSLDRREPSENIGDMYFWESMHHIHCIARSVYTGGVISKKVIGSMFVMPAVYTTNEPFDYGDAFDGKGLYLRYNDIVIVALLNDSAFALNRFMEYLIKISAPLTSLQYKEVFAHLVNINKMLPDRPIYYSSFSNDGYLIEAEIPEIGQMNYVPEDFGELLFAITNEELESYNIKDKEPFYDGIKKGYVSFLFDEKGEFVNRSNIDIKLQVGFKQY